MISDPERKHRNPIILPLVLLIVTSLAFWALPNLWKNKPVQVEFEKLQK